MRSLLTSFFFFFNDTATTEIYTLSLHDALPISAYANNDPLHDKLLPSCKCRFDPYGNLQTRHNSTSPRSEEHTSELQSHLNLVCRLLLEKKKNKTNLTPCMSTRSTPPYPSHLTS